MHTELDYIAKVKKEILTLFDIASLLYWDQDTSMPTKAVNSRMEQIKILNKIIQDKFTSRRLEEAINSLKAKKISKKNSMMLAELEKEIIKRKRVPKWLDDKLSKATLKGEEAWEKARDAADYSIFAPALKKMVALKRKEAKFLHPDLGIYESLLNEYEEEVKLEELRTLFSALKTDLKSLLDKIDIAKIQETQIKMKKKELKKFITGFMNKVGLDPGRMRISIVPMPFTMILSRNDISLGTNFDDPFSSIYATLHEAGHALYFLHLPESCLSSVTYDGSSMGIHESQSIFWESFIGKSPEFWKGYYPMLNSHTSAPDWESIYRSVNRINLSLIRTNADDISYIMHLILRFEIEQGLISGEIDTADAGKVWNQKCLEVFGKAPSSDNEGILQDTHWASGDFGYFPCYILGMIYAAQFYNQMLIDVPSAPESIEKQDFSQIIAWLQDNVYKRGELAADKILKKTCREGINPQRLITHLTKRYKDIYGF